MIYIDPPYNNAHGFIYEDDFAQEAGGILRRDESYGEQGHRLVQNLGDNASFHTDWLNMIYPRLRIARDLLAKDGVIFVSIDECEAQNLRKVCDEIFGEENFIAQIVRKVKEGTSHDRACIAIEFEYCFMYCKNIISLHINREIVDTKTKERQFVDNNEFRAQPLPYRAYVEFLNSEAMLELKGLVGDVFSYPKPVSLIKHLLKIASFKNSIILDFFSGSATTAHAVMQLNAEDGGRRKFIMVQIPEVCDEKSEAFKAGFKNICEIGKERIRRAGKKLADSGQWVVGSG
jgi:adenine-specific DNA-methyltransferase